MNIIKNIFKFIKALFRVIFTTIKITTITCLIVSIILGGYIGYKVYPMVMDAKIRSYDKLSSIDKNTFNRYEDTVIYDADGNKIGELNTSNYKYVPIEDVSMYIQEGYIAVEDNNFKTHNGVDYKAMLRAGIALVKNKGKITQGGSTITQQVIKNNLLTQERTYERKLIEFFLAQEFEKEYSKRKIMEFYVNTNFYGNNCYGIETASNFYFGKKSKDLTIPEAAMFVGMSNNANVYNPLKNPELVKEKRDFALKRMFEEGKITEEEYNDSIKQDLNLNITRELNEPESYQVSYALYSATLKLMELDNFEFQYTFDNKEEYDKYKESYSNKYREMSAKIRAGGYTIHTSLDSNKQKILQEAIDENLKTFTEKSEDGKYSMQGAAVAVDNRTGYVVAIVGGRGTDDQFNRGFLALRQPGSSIKPIILYAPAFDTGKYYPSLKLRDEKITLPNGKDGPKNYDYTYRGDMSLREAVVRSINTIAFKVFQDVTPRKGLEYLGKMNFSSLTYIDNDNLALSLGGFTYGTTVVDMAKAYYTLANNGEYTDNTCITKIELQNEGVIYGGEVKKVKVYEPESAYMMVDILKSVITERYSSTRKLQVKGVVTGGKTGTTNSQKDGWMCGISPYYSVAVWTGHDIPKQVKGLYGNTYPGSIWKDIMTGLHEGLPEKDFIMPENVKEAYVDWKGEPANYNTGKKDLISERLIQRAYREEQKQKDDN
jgi:penicillin-binding protein 1A